MLYLRCSHPRAERRWLDELPDDVLILIMCQCRIDDLLALRLVNSRSKDLIHRYIATIAPSSACASFPNGHLLANPLDDPSQYSIDWLKQLIPQHLASILVDRHRFSHGWTDHRYGIPAQDPYGDPLRDRVANGWRVLRQLSKISADIYAINHKHILKSSTDRAWRLVHPSKFKFEVFRQREEMILEKRLKYIKSISDDMAKDYKLMFMLLSAAFRTSISNYGDDYKPWIFDWGCGIDGQRLLRRGKSWLTWFVLHEGPDLFWNQWWSLCPGDAKTKDYIRDRSIEAWLGKSKFTPDDLDLIHQFLPKEWEDVNEKWHDLQRECAHKVQRAVEEKALASSDFTSVNPIMYFTQYAECRRIREETGAAPIPEIFDDVPFHVDFRTPEHLWQKFCLLREERAMELAARQRIS